MKIGINASFLRKPDSGIGQVTTNFVGVLSDAIGKGFEKYDAHEYIAYLEKDQNTFVSNEIEYKSFLPLYRRDDLVRKIWWERWMLPGKIAADGCDVFLSLYQCPTIVRGTKHVMVVHDAVWKRFPQYLGNSRKKSYYRNVDRAIRKADHIVTISESSKKDIQEFFSIQGEKITVALEDCDKIFRQGYSEGAIREVLKKYEIQDDYIFYVGGFDVRKNVESLIEAYAMMWKSHQGSTPIPKLILAGNFHSHLVPLVTDLPAVTKDVKEKYGLPKELIQRIGFVEQKDLPLLYQGASLFCYPSLYEGFGIPVLEAMASECPVVTSNVSSIPEVTGEDGALLVDPASRSEIAQAMFDLLMDEEKRNNFVQAGKRRAETFSWNKFLKTIFDTIDEVTQQ